MAGVNTVLKTVTCSVAINDFIEIRAVGTTISVWQNDILIDSVTDSSISSGQPGIYGYNLGWRGDNWT